MYRTSDGSSAATWLRRAIFRRLHCWWAWSETRVLGLILQYVWCALWSQRSRNTPCSKDAPGKGYGRLHAQAGDELGSGVSLAGSRKSRSSWAMGGCKHNGAAGKAHSLYSLQRWERWERWEDRQRAHVQVKAWGTVYIPFVDSESLVQALTRAWRDRNCCIRLTANHAAHWCRLGRGAMHPICVHTWDTWEWGATGTTLPSLRYVYM
ncbi:hypothetical protein BX600DRAFT_320475 [Xylariales sp. PMI_506]|nr:hypothetical protein BX600DRAFT_320475 [Xylariales sp. PMI_506]